MELREQGPRPTLAQKLGGGGHTFSAGTRIRDAMERVVERVLAEAIPLIQSSAPTGQP